MSLSTTAVKEALS